tara:strand:- start:592 stop:1383 length:792 start_codon:yes stop_codon:yes gene_type:complete
MIKKNIIILFLCFSWTQIEQAYPPINLVSIPTAGTLPRGSYTIETLLSKNGGFTPKISVGITNNFTFGVSFGIEKLIGDEKPATNKTTPELQIKYRVFEESESMPALIYGLDTQGRGNFIDTLFIEDSDSIAIVNRYEQKAWGMYLGFSKNWNLLGNFGLHGGICKSISENDDGDRDFNIFFGLDKEINRSFSLLLEYDAAINDNEYQIHEISFGKGKGYLNAGLRWAISPNVMMEINFNDINKNTDAEFTSREIKIMYSESF